MNDDRHGCPDPEQLAAFFDGNASRVELAHLTGHLSVCDRCLEILDGIGTVEHVDVSPTTSRRPRVTWLLPLAATLAVGILGVLTARIAFQPDPIRQLVATTPREGRYFQPRLTGGFPWAPMRTLRGAAELDAARRQQIRTAGRVVAATANDQSDAARHVGARAHAIAGRPAEAAALLRRITPAARSASIWSDLAATAYAAAIATDDATALREGLAAADAALRLAPRHAEARFNRALLLERLGSRAQARAAWQAYLAIDGTSGWAREAREHLELLALTVRSTPAMRVVTAGATRFANAGDVIASRYRRDSDQSGRTTGVQLLQARMFEQLRSAVPAATSIDAALLRASTGLLRAERVSAERALASLSTAITHVGQVIARREPQESLAALYLQRGRARVALGEIREAAADFEAGMRECSNGMATWRNVRAEQTATCAMALTHEQLLESSVTLALARADVQGAFTIAQGPRTLTLLDPAVVRAADDTIITYTTLPHRLVIFVIQDGKIQATQRAIDRLALTRDIADLTTTAVTRDRATFRRIARMLYDELIAPVNSAVAAERTLVVVPDATLSSVPFAALVGPHGRYVIEDHEVIVAPSASAWLARDVRERARARTLLLVSGSTTLKDDAEPLFSAYREAEAIAAAYPRADRLRRGGAAAFLRRAVSVDVIHFAGHAIASGRTTEAALLTASSPGNIQPLTASEISRLDLSRTQLVVLAACSTAGSGPSTADRKSSLARAFLSAGAPAVVGTLWDIEDDAAATFFPRFHQHVRQGLTPAAALRATQLDWLRQPDPTYLGMWASVQLLSGTERAPHPVTRTGEHQNLGVP